LSVSVVHGVLLSLSRGNIPSATTLRQASEESV
jgi:hypothetical protein